MNKYRYLFLFFLLVFTGQISAKDYLVSMFGVKSDGVTLNTTAIQRAIDFIHEEGGGRLVFNVGRYLTGTIKIKSNVTIVLNEGAVLLGSTNPYDYNIMERPVFSSFINAEEQENIGIIGRGVIDSRGRELAYNVIDQIHKGLLKDDLKLDRPAQRRPLGIYINKCKYVNIQGITIKNTSDWVQFYDHCEHLTIDGITVDSKEFWNNDGLDVGDSKHVRITNCYVDATDDGICLKSHDPNTMCEDIEIRNCVVRSSANGIKFGTLSVGGYKDIRIINNKVYDTFRSAFTIATPDGGMVENVLVDSLYAYNTGNAIYLRICQRNMKRPVGKINNVTIRNMYAEISAEKPDKGYIYEGPENEYYPRNISPASIVGLEGGHNITNIVLQNVEINHPGGGNPNYAYRGITASDLDSIPEMRNSYPEFSQFRELPAWGFYVRHACGIVFDNVKLKAAQKDYRPAIVIQEAEDITLKKMKYKEPKGGKKQVHVYKSKNIRK